MSLETGRSPIVTSVARASLTELYPPDGRLPSLIDDAREAALVRIASDKGEVLVKPPVFPYVRHHMLVIPDLSTHEPTDTPFVVPDGLLFSTLHTAGVVAAHYLDNSDVREVTVGWNHSKFEDKKHVATQQNTLHIHVIGYTAEDQAHTISQDEVNRRPELKMKEREPKAALIKTILENKVMSRFKEWPTFKHLFNEVRDGDRVTYELNQGIDTFNHPSLAMIMKRIHVASQIAYEELADCFFTPDQEEPYSYVESDDGRYALRSVDERKAAMEEYIITNDWLSDGHKKELMMLARHARSMEEVNAILQKRKGNEPLTDDEQYGQNKYMALKGLAYATVFTGMRQDDGSVSWIFGFDPVVFAPRDVVQASRGTFAHFERKGDRVLPLYAYEEMREDEERLADRLQQSS
ncbi:hypothetical protein HYS00_01045 [Candidatus Microgenomates bacterium]|nr:hypothetical protein [Candidatus Microgenomates bacterium]